MSSLADQVATGDTQTMILLKSPEFMEEEKMRIFEESAKRIISRFQEAQVEEWIKLRDVPGYAL